MNRDSPSMSTMTEVSPDQFPNQALPSPYISESAHVLSLQTPVLGLVMEGQELLSPGTRPFMASDMDSSPETIVHVPRQTSSSTKNFFSRAKRGLGSKLRQKSQKQVNLSRLKDITRPRTDIDKGEAGFAS